MITGSCPECGSNRVPSPLGGGRHRCQRCGLIRREGIQTDLEFAQGKPNEPHRPEPLENTDGEPLAHLEPEPLETR